MLCTCIRGRMRMFRGKTNKRFAVSSTEKRKRKKVNEFNLQDVAGVKKEKQNLAPINSAHTKPTHGTMAITPWYCLRHPIKAKAFLHEITKRYGPLWVGVSSFVFYGVVVSIYQIFMWDLIGTDGLDLLRRCGLDRLVDSKSWRGGTMEWVTNLFTAIVFANILEPITLPTAFYLTRGTHALLRRMGLWEKHFVPLISKLPKSLGGNSTISNTDYMKGEVSQFVNMAKQQPKGKRGR